MVGASEVVGGVCAPSDGLGWWFSEFGEGALSLEVGADISELPLCRKVFIRS